jgi:methylmalonyl-CoA/ethylmalonyl-CoA epimerase
MTHPFGQVHHVCIVVPDIEAAQAFYESVGITGWQEYPPLADYTDLDVPDDAAFFGMKYRYTDAPGLQLCEPNDGPSLQRKFLDRTGGGVFHIGFVVDDVDDATEQVHALGMKTWMYGRRGDRTGFTYFKTPEIAGVTLEVRQSPTS